MKFGPVLTMTIGALLLPMLLCHAVFLSEMINKNRYFVYWTETACIGSVSHISVCYTSWGIGKNTVVVFWYVEMSFIAFKISPSMFKILQFFHYKLQFGITMNSNTFTFVV